MMLKILKLKTKICIGGKIQNKLPKLQFMGLIKILKKDFSIWLDYIKKLNNKKSNEFF